MLDLCLRREHSTYCGKIFNADVMNKIYKYTSEYYLLVKNNQHNFHKINYPYVYKTLWVEKYGETKMKR